MLADLLYTDLLDVLFEVEDQSLSTFSYISSGLRIVLCSCALPFEFSTYEKKQLSSLFLFPRLEIPFSRAIPSIWLFAKSSFRVVESVRLDYYI